MNSELFSLDKKVVLVTGGYGYLGRAICRGLAESGALVYVLGRSKEKFADAFAQNNEKILFADCDVSETASIKRAFEEIYERENRIDVLVNNAFYVRGQKPLEISDDDWTFSIDGTLNSVYRCIREIAPFFLRNGGGKIINVSSMYGVVAPDFSVYDKSPAFLNPPHYGAAKAGVVQLTKYFAQYLGEKNIQVNAVSPGAFPSDAVRQRDENFADRLAAKTALKRVGKPEDLTGAFVFLSSKASDYITGHNLIVDGGWTIS